MAVAEVAYQWVWVITRMENISKLIVVTYYGERDVTTLVNQKFNSWTDDLPF